MTLSYSELKTILTDIGFNTYYKEEVSKNKHIVDYGPRMGTVEFNGLVDADAKYSYPKNSTHSIHIDKQLTLLNSDDNINDHDVILSCVEVFDWGGVQSSNIINAINRFRDSELTDYLISCRRWFEDDQTLDLNIDNSVWSSGWTKVYSFMFDKTAIYDSRVAAFINYIIIKFYHQLECKTKKEKIKKITSLLVSINGAKTRARRVSDSDRKLLSIRVQSKNDNVNLVANKVGSWFLRYLAELEYSTINGSQSEFRSIDKAAFMLGFDIDQIDKIANFK